MSDFLMRDEAPLTEEEWARLDETVVNVARQLLVGRRIIQLAGPFGPGLQYAPLDTLEAGGACIHENSGCHGQECGCEEGKECAPVRVITRAQLPLPEIHKDFLLRWRDLETSRQFGMPLDWSVAAAASATCAQAEDRMIFEKLLEAQGRITVTAADWEEAGNGFGNVLAATEKLIAAGFYAPYAAVFSPALYTKLHRWLPQARRLEIEQIKVLADGGVFQSPALTGNQALIIAQGPQNVDLVVAQDLITAYLGPEGMDHRFRVLESLALRIKRPGAICTFE